jgi:hypothetical protein
MVKLSVSAEQLITEGPFGVICRLYQADSLVGQGPGSGRVNVVKAEAVIGYIPVLENGDLVDITVADTPQQTVYVSFNEMVRPEND